VFNKIRLSISKPGLLFAYVKDKKRQILGYLLFMGLIMTLPIIITALRRPTELFPSTDIISKGIHSEFNDKGIMINDGKLENPNDVSKAFIVGEYLFIVGDNVVARSGLVIHFLETEISLYFQANMLITQEIATIPYEGTNLANISFTKENTSIIVIAVVNLLANQNILLYSNIIANFIFNIVQYLFIALIFTMLFRMVNRLPLSFGASFKLSFYITTTWALISLILTLFGINDYFFVAYLFVYINHVRAYRSIRVVRKIKVGNKNE